jgi:hypothetical protein
MGGLLFSLLNHGATKQQSMNNFNKFAPLIIILALVLAILGTIAGKLPGTRKQ